MKGTTHLAAGVAWSVAASAAPLSTGLILLGSLLPDIDIGTSKLGRYNPVSFVIPHRTITHSLLFTAACYLISPFLAYGVITHLILDMFNPEGVALLWPFPNKSNWPVLGVIRSGGAGDYVFMAMLLALSYLFYTKSITIPNLPLFQFWGKLWA